MIKCNDTVNFDWITYNVRCLNPVITFNAHGHTVEFPTGPRYCDFRRVDKNILIQTTYDYGTGGIV